MPQNDNTGHKVTAFISDPSYQDGGFLIGVLAVFYGESAGQCGNQPVRILAENGLNYFDFILNFPTFIYDRHDRLLYSGEYVLWEREDPLGAKSPIKGRIGFREGAYVLIGYGEEPIITLDNGELESCSLNVIPKQEITWIGSYFENYRLNYA